MTLSAAPIHHAELVRLRDEFSWDVREHAEWLDGYWQVSDGGDTDTAFDYSTLALEDIAQESWWFRARNAMLLRTVRSYCEGRCLWDVGGGVGTVAHALEADGQSALVVEPDVAGARFAGQRGTCAIAAPLHALRLPSGSLGAVGVFDVLEHLRQPGDLLEEIGRVLVPGGKVVMTVPALQSLWSEADELAGHFMRYDLSSIRHKFAEHGFQEIWCSYWFRSLTAAHFVTRALPYRLGRRHNSMRKLEAQLQPSRPGIASTTDRMERLLSSTRLPGTSIVGVFSRSPL